MRGPTGSLGVKGLVKRVPGGQGGGLRCPIGSPAIIDRSKGVKWDDVWAIPWGHRVGLMSLLMIHKAYMPVYISDPDF